jgi:hypothetical protein
MRIRSTKPEFWHSERVASVDWEDRLLLKGLESYVDDNGVGKDDVALIIGDLFPRDAIREPSRTLTRVSEGLTRLEKAGLLHRYAVDETSFLFLSFWETFQRIDKATRGRFPRPDGTLNYGQSRIGAPSREPSRALAPGTGEQGNRGTEEQGKEPPSPLREEETSTEVALIPEEEPKALAKPPKKPRGKTYPEGFERFWSVYPRRDDKADAFKAWQSLPAEVTLEEIVAGAERYRDDPNRTPQFTKLPATWIRAGSWENGPLPRRAPESQKDRLQDSRAATLAALDRMGVA